MMAHMDESAERLTEVEWEKRRARQECSTYGHDWQILQTVAGPVSLICARPCGDPGYRIVRASSEKAGEA